MKKTIIRNDERQPVGWFDEDKAIRFTEDRRSNGSNLISVATGSQWSHEALFLTRKHRWVLNEWSDWQGSADLYSFVNEQDAFRWLVANRHDEVLLPTAIAARFLAYEEAIEA